MHANGFMTFSVSNGCFGQEKTPLLQANICEGFGLVFSRRTNQIMFCWFVSEEKRGISMDTEHLLRSGRIR